MLSLIRKREGIELDRFGREEEEVESLGREWQRRRWKEGDLGRFESSVPVC